MFVGQAVSYMSFHAFFSSTVSCACQGAVFMGVLLQSLVCTAMCLFFCWLDVCFCVQSFHCVTSFSMTAVVLLSWLSPAIGMLSVCVLFRPVCVFCAIMRISLLCHVCRHAFLSFWFRISELLLGVCHGAMASMSALCCRIGTSLVRSFCHFVCHAAHRGHVICGSAAL